MKKGILKWLMVLVVAMLCMPQIFALEQVRVRVNGVQVYFPDGQPYIDSNSRVLVPVRFVSEQLGAKVDWDASAKRVTITEGNNKAVLNIDSKQIMVNGEIKVLDTAAIIKGTRTYVPLRFVSEALGAEVKWDSKVRIVYIDNGKAPLPEVKVFEKGPFSIPITADCMVFEKNNTAKITTAKQVTLSTYSDGYMALLVAPGMKVDYSVQCDEAERILQQAVTPAEAKKIIDFARTKSAIDHKIGEKIFDTEHYTIEVNGNQRTVNIRIYSK